MKATLVREGVAVDYTTAVALDSGDIVTLQDGTAGVYAGLKSAVAGELIAAYRGGRLPVYSVPKATGTVFAAGQAVYADLSAGLAVTTPGESTDLYLGTADRAAGSGLLTVDVQWGTPGMGAGSTGMRTVISTRKVEIDHADTAEFELLAAAENHGGFILDGFLGQVTETIAGSSEDQLVITLYDSDDNALSTLTTTNTTPDVAGDIVVGTQGVQGAATGAVLKTVPAGKGLYAKVTQATAGTPAGKIKVWAKLDPLL